MSKQILYRSIDLILLVLLGAEAYFAGSQLLMWPVTFAVLAGLLYFNNTAEARRWAVIGCGLSAVAFSNNFIGLMVLVVLDLINAAWVFGGPKGLQYLKAERIMGRAYLVGFSTFFTIMAAVLKDTAPEFTEIAFFLLILLRLVNWPMSSLMERAAVDDNQERKKEAVFTLAYVLFVARTLHLNGMDYKVMVIMAMALLALIRGRVENVFVMTILALSMLLPEAIGGFAPAVLLLLASGFGAGLMPLFTITMVLILPQSRILNLPEVLAGSGLFLVLVGRAFSIENWKTQGREEIIYNVISLSMVVLTCFMNDPIQKSLMGLTLDSPALILATALFIGFVFFSVLRIKWPKANWSHGGLDTNQIVAAITQKLGRLRPSLRYPKANLKWIEKRPSRYELIFEREGIKVLAWLFAAASATWGIIWLGL